MPPVGGPPGTPGATSSSSPARSWLPFAAILGAVAAAAGLVAVLLLALGGSAGHNVKNASITRTEALQLLAANGVTTVSQAAPGLFAAAHAGRITALVPAGWRATAQAANSAARAEFSDPKQTSSTLTIVDLQHASGSDHTRAVAARHSVATKGYTRSYFGPTTFPGGRSGWRLTYSSGGVTHSTYFYSACNGSDAMVIDVSAPTPLFQREQATLEIAAQNAEPQC